MQHYQHAASPYFYERRIGCVGVLKDWLLRAVLAALDGGDDTLTLQRMQEHALSISQCEQMTLDAIEDEQKLNYREGRREHLWRRLQGEEPLVPVPRRMEGETQAVHEVKEQTSSSELRQEPAAASSVTEPPLKRSEGALASMRYDVMLWERLRLQRTQEMLLFGSRGAGHCSSYASGHLETPMPGVWCYVAARIGGDSVVFPPYPPRTTRMGQAVPRWIKQGKIWRLSFQRV